ncbi:MAG: FtsW/RodA/SpoVE family cell cycle protein [Prolixibacteraceae bacterium]|jgi:cell division protein FtsW|nr:FtsW/RodA/SpoVE family cell cycle protein [Prolixibacteraceae bacterium]MBT6006276.1 FtsW/RodA/SpoVE family cell cycle protein [Prolixibacteraceae bacterium]MBT6764769.1 FtsW/RodA/SpoVE family cell cycle protein [Prolixibacteraceae bacterium]MBT6997466.1 FtsW/RodA/SpoVE family cell cycle protein [Prolixibacteraceae bacterium]MBT7395578.1 FtsW/RodA/SpoVE family cell cycle protein [Prolixibacteraceae bacterium]
MGLAIQRLFRGDRVIWTVLLLLSLLSLLIVYSSTGALAYRVASGNTFYYLVRQMFFLGAGFALILFMVNVVPVKIYSMAANSLVYFSIALLVLTLSLKIAGIIDGSGRTLDLGFVSFQPAEVAKISLILLSAKILAKKRKTRNDDKKTFKRIIFFTLIICGLIFMVDFSTSALLFSTIMTMMFIGRIPFKYLLLVVASGAALIAMIYFFTDRYPEQSPEKFHTIKGRIDRFIYGDPNSGNLVTQADYSKLAIYKGGILGKGPGSSEVSNYIAAAYSDYIFAIIVEEYGLLFGAGVLFLYLIFFFRGALIVRKSTRTFPAFLVTGLTLILIFQAMINIGVSSGLLPVTGQPLPWVSLGGTSLLFTSIAFGCILSVSHQNQVNRKIQKQPIQVNAPDEDYEMEK